MKNILIILVGESYRSGGQQTRIRGTRNYKLRQLLASKSHISLVNKLSKDNNVFVSLNTYKLNEIDDNILYKYYNTKTQLIDSTFYDPYLPHHYDMLNETFNKIKSGLNNYDYIITIRMDCYLKHYFIDNLILDSSKILFTHIDGNMDVNNNYIPIECSILIIPNKFYYKIYDNTIYNICHDIFDKLLKNGLSMNDIGIMTNTTHVCCTSLGWNPFYILVGRDYSTTYSNKGQCQAAVEYYFNIKDHKLIHDINKTVLYWKPYLNIDTLEENLEKLNILEFDCTD
jgi:hypothetical protein